MNSFARHYVNPVVSVLDGDDKAMLLFPEALQGQLWPRIHILQKKLTLLSICSRVPVELYNVHTVVVQLVVYNDITISNVLK